MISTADFLTRPLLARVALNAPSGPTVRPVWFLYEEAAFWWITSSSYTKLPEWLTQDPRAALVVDHCDLDTGQVFSVTVRGNAVVCPMDHQRASRKLAKYLGPERRLWPERFRGVFEDERSRLIALRPAKAPVLRDMSFDPPAA